MNETMIDVPLLADAETTSRLIKAFGVSHVPSKLRYCFVGDDEESAAHAEAVRKFVTKQCYRVWITEIYCLMQREWNLPDTDMLRVFISGGNQVNAVSFLPQVDERDRQRLEQAGVPADYDGRSIIGYIFTEGYDDLKMGTVHNNFGLPLAEWAKWGHQA